MGEGGGRGGGRGDERGCERGAALSQVRGEGGGRGEVWCVHFANSSPATLVCL